MRTATAREKVRQWFRRQQRHENIARGRDLVEKELKRFSLAHVSLDEIASQFRYEKLDDFLAAVGYGDVNPHQVSMRLAAELQPEEPPALPTVAPAPQPARGLKVLGVGDLLTRLARCCNPVPGDTITGYITRGKGVTVHRVDCASVAHEEERDRFVDVEWGTMDQQVFPVTVRVECWDRVGLVRDLTAIVADEKISISAISTVVHKDQTATVWCTLEVTGLDKLSRVLSRIEGMRDVFEVVREVGVAPVQAQRA
jgi:GTP pyrophosphokinase